MKTNISINIQEKIDKLIEGKLNQDESDDLWAIMIMNPHYIEYMKTAQAFKSLGKEFADKAIQSAKKQSSKLQIYLSAAAVLLIGCILGIAYILTPTQPVYLAPLGTIELDNVRSTETYTGSKHLLQTAIAHLLSGEDAEAFKIIESIKENPEFAYMRTEAIILSGIINYNAGNHEEALHDFQIIIKEEPDQLLVREQAHWYAANALLHLNREQEAIELLRTVIEMDGAFSRAATNLLENR